MLDFSFCVFLQSSLSYSISILYNITYKISLNIYMCTAYTCRTECQPQVGLNNRRDDVSLCILRVCVGVEVEHCTKITIHNMADYITS